MRETRLYIVAMAYLYLLGLTQFADEYLRTARRWRGFKPRQQGRLHKSHLSQGNGIFSEYFRVNREMQ